MLRRGICARGDCAFTIDKVCCRKSDYQTNKKQITVA